MRALGPDRAEARGFLALLADLSMFLLAALDRPEVQVWRWPDQGAIAGLFGLTPAGYAMVQSPDGLPLADLRQALIGARLLGLTGPAGQVAPLRDGLGLIPAALDRIEPMLALDLAGLVMPDGPGVIGPAKAADLLLIAGWRAASNIEITGAPPGDVTDRAAYIQAERMIESGTGRLPNADGKAVAMMAFNAATPAQAPDRVQVGAVHTDPARRNRGAARRLVALALALAEARQGGAARAVLFTGSPDAERAWRAIGFDRVGQYHLLILADPMTLGPA